MTLTLTAVAAPTLRLSGDRKVSPLVRQQGSKQAVLVSNAFGLSSGRDGSCGDATDVCEALCYADAIENLFKASGRLVAANYAALSACGDNIDAMVDLLTPMVDQFVKESSKRNVAEHVFRIHWSGDFFSVAYALAWRAVAELYPDVQFWVYTRSYRTIHAAHVLDDLPNVALYLSVDRDNVDAAADVLPTLHTSVRVAALGGTYAEAQTILDRLGRSRAPKCPENAGTVPLVTTMNRRGKPAVGENGQGACIACGLCVYGRKDVLFSTTGK